MFCICSQIHSQKLLSVWSPTPHPPHPTCFVYSSLFFCSPPLLSILLSTLQSLLRHCPPTLSNFHVSPPPHHSPFSFFFFWGLSPSSPLSPVFNVPCLDFNGMCAREAPRSSINRDPESFLERRQCHSSPGTKWIKLSWEKEPWYSIAH